MSRVGNSVIAIPSGVHVVVQEQTLVVSGRLGKLSTFCPSFLAIHQEEDKLKINLLKDTKQSRMMWGTVQRHLSNMVRGVNEGFSVDLDIVGVGYRAAVQGKELVLQLGFSHEVKYSIPDGITVKCEKPTAISLHGVDKQKIGQMAAEIRSYRPPEPYKGKGIARQGEYIPRKVGKKK